MIPRPFYFLRYDEKLERYFRTYHLLSINKFDKKYDELFYAFSIKITPFSLNLKNDYYGEIINKEYSMEENTKVEFFSYGLKMEKIIHLKYSSFMSFFISNTIDTPVCFKKINSLKRQGSQLPVLKFSNFLMRKGKKEKFNRILWQSFFNFWEEFNEKFYDLPHLPVQWLKTHFLINNLIISKNILDLDNFDIYETLYGNSVTELGKSTYRGFFIKTFLESKISQIIPVFSYFMQNVDKNIRKFSRGKSGKYRFVWKFIPVFKRIYVAYRWIFKDIKFHHEKTLRKRISENFLKLSFELTTTFGWRAKNYSYKHIFKNMRRTLMKNLKTVAK